MKPSGIFYHIACFLASGCAIGYSPIIPGTLGSLWGIPLFIVFSAYPISYFFVICMLIVLGIWAIPLCLQHTTEHDPSFIFIDEVIGFCVATLFLSFSMKHLLLAFLFFRLFDMTKCLGIRRWERLPGAWGVLADDIVAGLYANVMVRLIGLF